MTKKFILFTVVAILVFANTHAQVMRLIGYKETALDSYGVMLNYNAYWNTFSGNRGSTIAHFQQVGFIHYDFFVDASAADTTRLIDVNSSGANKDSTMKVWKYDSNDNPIESKKYKWSYSTTSWTPHAVERDSFVYSSNQLIGRYFFAYHISTGMLTSTATFLYTYNTSGKLISEENVGVSRFDYTWSGNDMTNMQVYEWVPSLSIYRLQSERATTYVGSKAITQTANGWYYLSGVPHYYAQTYDSNIYSGSILTNRYSLYSGYYTAMYPFNFREAYQYDIKGNISQIIFEMVDSFGVWKNWSKKEFTYNSDNNPLLIKHYDYDANSNSWKPAWRGNITTKQYFYYPFPASVVTSRTENDIKVYPSPAQYTINLKTAFKKETTCNMAITDMQGRLLRQWEENIPSGNTATTIPVDNLPVGSYLLRLRTPAETIVKDFSVIR